MTNENDFDHFYVEHVCSIEVSNICSLVFASNKTPTTFGIISISNT